MFRKTRKLVAMTAMGVSLFSSTLLPLVAHAEEKGNQPQNFSEVNYNDVNSLQEALNNQKFPFIDVSSVNDAQYNSFTKQQEAYKQTRNYFVDRLSELGADSKVPATMRTYLLEAKNSNYGFFKDIEPVAPDTWVALFNRPSDGVQYTENILREHKIDGQHALCIDPGIAINGTPNYTASDLTDLVGKEKADKISAIHTVATENWNDNVSIAAQEMAWEIQGAKNMQTEPMRKAVVDQAKAEIQKGADALLTPVKLDKTTANVEAGQSATFNVESGGKDLYVASVSNGATAKLEGSKIVVTTKNDAPDEVTVTLGKGKKDANHYVWKAGNNQKLVTADYNNTNATQVKLSLTKKGKIIVHKKDDNGKPLSNAEFTQYDKTGKAVAVKKTDKNGDVSFDIASNNTYEVKETKNPVGYHGTFDQKNITLANNGQTFEYEAKNIQDTGKILVHKKDENGKALSNAEFTQYDKTGKAVAVKKTDKNGDVSFDIASNNTYEVKETKNPVGYHGTFDQKNITLANNGQTFEYEAKNIQNKGKIIIHKKDEKGKAVVGAEFTETNQAGKVVAMKKSDKEGNVTFDIQSNDTYKVKETKVPDGYEGSFEKDGITLKDDGQKFEYTAVNNHKHEEIIQTGSTNYQNKGLIGLAVAGIASLFASLGYVFNKRKHS